MDRTTGLRLAAASLLGLSVPLSARAAHPLHERRPAPAHHPLPERRPVRAMLTQVLTLPAGIPSGGFVLQNPTGATLAARDRTTGVGFAKGVVPQGGGVTATVAGTASPVQLDVLSQWPDGSARWAGVTVPAPALAAGASVPVALTPTGSPAAGTALAWTSPALTINLLGSTLDLGAALANSTDTWLSGALAVQRRVDLPVPGDATGAMHVVADVTVFASGPPVADVSVRRDIATVQPASGGPAQAAALAPLSYTATVVFNGATTTQAVANQNQYQDWHLVLGGDGVNVQHDIAGLEAAGLIPPYDLAMGIATGANTGYAQVAAIASTSGYGQPLSPNGVLVGMNTTGGRYDIGITTGVVAVCLRTQDPVACGVMYAQADAGGSVPWHFWNASTGRWLDAVDYPTLWAMGNQGSYLSYLTNAMPPQDTSNTPSTQPWDIATSHQPNLDYIPALLTGSRYYRDMQQSQASGGLVWEWAVQRGATQSPATGDQLFGNTNGDGSTAGPEVREIAWDYRETVEAWALASPGSVPLAHLTKVLADSWTWWNSPGASPAWTAAEGAIGTFVPGRYTSSIYPPWQQDYLASAVGMGVLLGDPGAAQAFPGIVSSREAMGVPQTGYDPKWSMSYNDTYADSTGKTITSTWPAFQAANVANNGNNANTLAQMDQFGDYDSLLRQTMAMALRVNPSDTTAPLVLAGLYGAITASNSNISVPTYQGNYGNLVQEALAIPTVTPSNAWVAQEAALASGGSGSSSATGSSSTGTSGSSGSSSSGTSSASSSTGSTGTSTVASTVGTALTVSGVTLPNPGEPMSIAIGGLHLATANGVTAAAAAGAIPVTATTLPSSCRPGDAYYVRGARLGTQAAGAGLDAPGYCNASGQVVLTATGLPPTF